MAATRAFLVRSVEQIKRFADMAPATRGVNDTQFIEDIRRAHAAVHIEIARSIGPEAQYFYATKSGITLTVDQEWLAMPATFRKFIHLVQRDGSAHKNVLSWIRHTPGAQGDPGGVVPLPDLRRLRFQPLISAQAGDDWELAFETGPIELHFGNPTAHLSATSASYTDSTKTVSKTGAFANYTFKTGDVMKITAGAGISGFPIRHTIKSKTDDDSVVLVTDAGNDSTNDVVFDIYKADRIHFMAIPTKGELMALDDYYIGARIYMLSGNGVEEVNQVIGYTASTREATLLESWTTPPDDVSVYEIRPWVPGRPDQFDELITWRAVLKYRRIRADDGQAEASAVREIKSITGEAIRFLMDANRDSGTSYHKPRRSLDRSIWGPR